MDFNWKIAVIASFIPFSIVFGIVGSLQLLDYIRDRWGHFITGCFMLGILSIILAVLAGFLI